MHTTVIATSAASPTPADAPVRAPGAAARLANLIVHPPEAFWGIADRPAWALAFAAIVVVRVVSLFVFYHPQATPVKILATLAFQVGTVLPALLVTGTALWFAGALWRARIAWPVAFSIGTHAYLAYTLATVAAASVAGALLPGESALDPRNPPFTNLAPLLSEAAHPVATRVLAALDLRMAYAFVLAWIGVHAAIPRAGRLRAAGVVAAVAVARLAFSVAASR